MKFANLVLVRLFQFVTFVLFTFMVLVYFGTLLLIPLDVLYFLVVIFSFVGMHGAIAILLAISLVAYLGYLIYKMPDLYQALLNIGIDLAQFGRSQIMRFEAIAVSVEE